MTVNVLPVIPADAVYFPEGAFGWKGHAKWFAKQLRAMGEPPLYGRTDRMLPAIRFLWLRTFQRPICMRVEGPPGPKLVATRMLGMAGFEHGEVEQRWARAISEEEWCGVQRILADERVWNAPKEASAGLDGAEWILEAVVNGTYRVARRWCPEADGEDAAFRSACLGLVALAGDDIIDGDVY